MFHWRNFVNSYVRQGVSIYLRKGGHEKWTRRDLTRPIIVQTHISPIPEFIIKNALRNMGLTKKDFFEILFDCKE